MSGGRSRLSFSLSCAVLKRGSKSVDKVPQPCCTGVARVFSLHGQPGQAAEHKPSSCSGRNGDVRRGRSVERVMTHPTTRLPVGLRTAPTVSRLVAAALLA